MRPPVFVSFGEIMLRLAPPGKKRLLQTDVFEATYGGGEANVAVSLAQFGIASSFVSALPQNELGQAALNALRSWGVDTSAILRSGNRLGIYFLEHGASQRPSTVLYDRAGSSIAEIEPDSIDWNSALAGATWFHFTGITPALSAAALQTVRKGAETAKQLGLTVSCDLNYRSKLWSRDDARSVMTSLMGHVDVLLANEEDADSVFGIHASDVHSGHVDQQRYVDVARQLTDRFGFQAVGITLRESISASRNGWSGLLFAGGQPYFSRHYEVDIVDRVGGGDSFAAGVIYGLLKSMSPQDTIEFAAAASCLKHSVPGDLNVATVTEVEALLKSGGSGRVQR
jgi:2-dehydro-3-deoxygluconokinase